MASPAYTPEPKAVMEHLQYNQAVRKWYTLTGEEPPNGASDHYPGPSFCSFIGTNPQHTFTWVNYPSDHKIYVPACCVGPMRLLLSPYATTIVKAYCLKHGLDVPKLADSAVV